MTGWIDDPSLTCIDIQQLTLLLLLLLLLVSLLLGQLSSPHLLLSLLPLLILLHCLLGRGGGGVKGRRTVRQTDSFTLHPPASGRYFPNHSKMGGSLNE